MFITFVDASDASQFYNEAITSHHILHGSELKIGWGKPNTMTLAIQNALRNGASRNVYLGMLDESTTEESLRDNLSRFGYIEHIRMIPEKRIAFVHFLCITNAIKCVNTLPTESTWHLKRVNFGKDRCTRYQFQQKILYQPHSSIYSPLELFSGLPMVFQQQNRRDLITGLANRTVYLGNIHPDTTAEDICNVIRGGILSQIRFLPEKHIAFITFVDPNLASLFITQTLQQCLIVKGRRLKIGWGKPSALPIQVIQAVQNGGSRNVYIGNIDDSITEKRLKHDFSEYGDIELVNTLKEKKCAFVNFTSIASAVRAIEGIKSKEEYKKFHINYGKDRCGNPPKTQQRTRQGEDEDVQV
ncbi:hypothetical protein CU098_000456 [Rhizopus stolonifer]|uniref:RRM domain-containing protein n=1 Tax=Rhizopus stolonifer TaxID=4846 RepID=A0A367KRV4_RHIST|nr:hypothetical protein CU098_000456 [Rhizopus stolonifer]